MANPASPFASSASQNTSILLPIGHKLIIRCDSGSVRVIVKVGKDAQAADADYFLDGGDAVEISYHDATTVNVLAITGTPNVYWRIQRLTIWN